MSDADVQSLSVVANVGSDALLGDSSTVVADGGTGDKLLLDSQTVMANDETGASDSTQAVVANDESDASDSDDDQEINADFTEQQRTVFKRFCFFFNSLISLVMTGSVA